VADNQPVQLTEADMEEIRAIIAVMDEAYKEACKNSPSSVTNSWEYLFVSFQHDVAHQITLAMEKEGLNISDLAKRAGFARSSVHRLLHSTDRNFQVKTLAKFAHALGREIRIELVPKKGAVSRKAKDASATLETPSPDADQLALVAEP
jgi:transcriptional regulator with XRE-family HTH domain